MKRIGIALSALLLILAAGSCKGGPTPPDPPPATNYTLSVVCSPANGGSVTKSPNQSQYASGTNVQLQATASSGYTFTRWEGGLTGTSNPATINMNGNKTVTAVFSLVPANYTLSVTCSPSNGGAVIISPSQATYSSGTVVTLEARSAPGCTFTGWQGDLTGTTNPATITMNGNKSVTAVFATPTQYTLSVVCSPTNGGSVTKSPNQTQYSSGATVQLQATPASGYTFTRWEGSLTGTSNPATITMNGNKSVTAVFSSPSASIHLSTSSLSFTATQGGSAPAAQTVSITNGGSGTLSGLSCSFPDGTPTWLTVSLSSQTAPATFTVNVLMQDPFGHAFGGTLTSRILISSASASNSPQTLNVTATYLPPAELTAYATYDNTVLYISNVATAETTVYSSGYLVVGNDYLWNFLGYDLSMGAAAIYFNVQSQIQGRSIASATLRIYAYQVRGDFSFTPRVRARAIATNWSPSTLTMRIYNTMYFYTTGVVEAYAPSTSSLPVDFDVTTIVRNWASGAFSNYGISLEGVNHYYPGSSSLQATHFQSLETYYSASQRPQLIIRYQ